MDHTLYWRRSITAATACKVIGEHLGIESHEDLFLAGLLQDIGMLVLDKVLPNLYQDLGADQASHQRVREVERQSLGDDHAAVGAWLLHSWHLPQRTICATAGSHDSRRAKCDPKYQSLVRCVALAGALADIWCGDDYKRATQEASQLADALFDMDKETFASLLAPVATEAMETAALFDTKLDDEAFSEYMLEQAKETLMLRGLQNAQRTAKLQQTAMSLEVRARKLEEETRRDGLTGLYNRAHLDRLLGEEFASAKRHGWPLAVAFIDLDYFKRINDSYGHHAGDQILKVAGSLLQAMMRTTDIVARYGGEEFVALLPGTGAEGAKVAGERLVKAFADTHHPLGDYSKVVVTTSVGVATQGEGADFEHPEDLLRAADRALYVAKLEGRNRCVVHTSRDEPEGTSSSIS
jgi:diguanylate cyclase (GGDEF)-like protein